MTERKDDERNGMTRRQLFGLGGAAAGGAMLGGLALPSHRAEAEEPAAPSLPQVPRRKLGKTGKEIPILLMGGAMGFDQRFDPRLAEAFRFGVNYIDAADCYAGGRCETGVAAFHTKAKNRGDIWITSKSDKHDPEGFEKTFLESLQKLSTDYVDLYYLHMLEDASYLSPAMLKVVEKYKRSGQMRHFGFSCHGGNVAELLRKAAATPWVESVMFRYNFRSYGNKELNDAIDAAHKANVGLIAMKTQGSEASFADSWKKFEQTGKFTKHQAVLKAVWGDPRITAAVSHMDNFDKLRQNIAAALDKSMLSAKEMQALHRYADETRSLACDGCDHICGAAVAGSPRIGDTIRFVMYHDHYGEETKAKQLFAKLPAAARRLSDVDFAPANAACPNGVDVAALMKRAEQVLA